jgi:hypothetical protein
LGSEWLGFYDTPRSLDVYRLRKRGTGKVRLETFAILDNPPEAPFLNLEWASGWPAPHGSDVVGGPQHVELEEGWREFIGYRAEIDDVDAEPRKLWKVEPGPPQVRVVNPDEAMPVPRFREVSAGLAVDPSRDDVDSVAERLASLLSADEIASYWARLQLELGEMPWLVGDVVSRSRDSEQYLLMEEILAGDRHITESDWGELFLDVADQAGSLVEGIPLVYSFDSDTPVAFSPFTDYLSLVMGYFRGRRPGTRAGEEFFYVFTTHYYSGGGHLYPRDMSRAQAEKVLAPLGLELAGEPQFQEHAMTTVNVGATVELAY